MLISASPNDYSAYPWPDDLPDVPFFLNQVVGLWETDNPTILNGANLQTALAMALHAAAEALCTGSSSSLDWWGENYDPAWGQS